LYAMRLWIWYVASQMEVQFSWSPLQRQMVIGAFLPGFILMQVVGGWLASRYGGKRVMRFGTLIAVVCSVLVPVAAQSDRMGLLLAVRVVSGVGEGMAAPAFNAMLGRWAPPLERSTLSSIAYCGGYFGAMIAALLARVAVGPDAFEWEGVSYLLAASTAVWMVSFEIFAYDGPGDHPTISSSERSHIISTVSKKQLGHGYQPVPWRRIFGSGAVWSMVASHVGSDAVFYLLLWSGHAFLTDIYGVDFNYADDNVGLIASAVPYATMLLFAFGAAVAADLLLRRGWAATTVRKLFTTSSLLLAAVILILMGYLNGASSTSTSPSTTSTAAEVPTDNVKMGVTLYALVHGALGLGFGGWRVNHLDIGPRYAGVLLGITATISTLVGAAIPFVSDHNVHCARCANITNPCNGLYFINTNTNNNTNTNHNLLGVDAAAAAAAAAVGGASIYGFGNSSHHGGGGGGGSAGTGTFYACPSFAGGYGSGVRDNVGYIAGNAGVGGGTATLETSFGPGDGAAAAAAAAAQAAEVYSNAAGLLLSNCTVGPGTANAGFTQCSREESHASWRTVFWVPVGLSLFGLLGYLCAGSAELQEWNSPSYRGLIHKVSKAQWKTILSDA